MKVVLFINNNCIVHSPNKYRETEGRKDIGANFWNQGRTDEINNRFVHLDCHELGDVK